MIGRLIAASVEAKRKPTEYAADREALVVVSCKVLEQQSSQLLGMLHDRLAFHGFIDENGKPANNAGAKIAGLSEHQRTWVPYCYHHLRVDQPACLCAYFCLCEADASLSLSIKP